MAYSAITDLLTGDVQFGTTIDPQKAVDDASDEMDVRLGMVYRLPISGLPTHLVTLLKMVNNRLASGRLIMAAATASQSRELHAYGQSLVEMAFSDLGLILNGNIVLEGAVRRDDVGRNNAPSIVQRDTYSAVDAFEGATYFDPAPPWNGVTPNWRPGD